MTSERSPRSDPPAPPETERREVVEELHGREVVDPYRWLEGDDEEVRAWVDAQNEYADRLLGTDTREALRPRLEAMAAVESHLPVTVAGGTRFQRIEPAGADHPVLYVYRSDGTDPERLVDPNEWPEGRSMDWYVPSPDGDLVAYGVAEGGTEQYDLVVVDLAGGTVDRVEDVGRTNPGTFAWYDGGFYYVRTGDPGAGGQLRKEVRRHDMGGGDGTDPGGEDGGDDGGEDGGDDGGVDAADPGDDEVIHDGVAPDVWPVLDADEDGRLVATFNEMSVRADVYAYAPGDDGLTPALVGEDASFVAHVHGSRDGDGTGNGYGDGNENGDGDGIDPRDGDEVTVYLRTDHDAPRGRVLAAPFEELLTGGLDVEDLRVVLPEREAVLRGIAPADGYLLAHRHRDAVSELSVHDPTTGERLRGLAVPGVSSVTGLAGDPAAPEAFFRVESFDRPPAVYRADPGTGETERWNRDDVPLAGDLALSVSRESFESADGTEVPAFVVHRTDLDPTDEPGGVPTVLYGYGGFRNNMTPTFGKYHLPFLADGGVFVQAVLRGGAEYGEEWHEAGMRANKANVFEDFLAVARGLTDRGITAPDRLAATGGSNGGLLVGAAVTRAPELFGAAVSAVPLLDMLRFHRFLLGEAWTNEYGSPEDPEAFEWLSEYSPYHNVERRSYPAVLFRTAEGDTRVHPAHARKMAALLQERSTSGEPVVLRTVRETGHGLGKPTAVEVREQLDEWTFLYDRLGLDPDGDAGGA